MKLKGSLEVVNILHTGEAVPESKVAFTVRLTRSSGRYQVRKGDKILVQCATKAGIRQWLLEQTSLEASGSL